MNLSDLAYAAPESVDSAIGELAKWDGQARALAGGMSLLPAMHLGVARPRAIVSLSRIAELREIREIAGELRVGALVTHHVLSRDPLIARCAPLLAAAAGGLADVQVRNRGTLGGSLANAYPGADAATVLSVLGAQVVIRGTAGERRLPVVELIQGESQTVLGADELIVAVVIGALPADARAHYIRFARIQGNYSVVNAAALIERDGVRIAIGGATRRPVVVEFPPIAAAQDELALRRLAQHVQSACTHAYDDHMASAEYRRAMAGVLARRAAIAALASLDTA